MKNTILSFILLAASSLSFADAQNDMQSLFNRRLDIRAKASIANKDLMKSTLEDFRDREELLGEQINSFHSNSIDSKSAEAFSTPYLLNPNFNKLEFKSGDVLVLRGMSALSALVSNLTDTPSSYSHSLVVFIDAAQKKWAVEALIDSGVVAHPLEEIFTEGVPRVMVYRQKDAALAAKAAELAFRLAQPDKDGKKLGYDMKLNMLDYSAVYCSELIRMIYDISSNQTLVLPSFPSTIGGKFTNIQKALKLNIGKFSVYAPLDIDLESSFDLVAEWRDFNSTVNYRIKDQIVKTVLTWLETQKANIEKANAVYTSTKSLTQNASAGSPAPATAADSSPNSDAVPKLLSGLSTILNIETKAFSLLNQQFLLKQNRNMTNTEIRSAIDKSSLFKLAKVTFIQTGFLKY